MRDEYLRYLGVLGLLAECSVHVDEELRELIERAFEDACTAHSNLRWRRVLDRIEIEPMPDAIDPSVSATGATDPGMPDPRD